MSEMIPYHSLFPHQALQYVEYLKLKNELYSMFELFCADPKCDCRRVMINIYKGGDFSQGQLATINFGWEKEAFYKNWSPSQNPKELKGPELDPFNKQSNIAKELLEVFIDKIKDEDYLNNLKAHYFQFKEEINSRKSKPIRNSGDVNRNDPCPCGSGKKFKKCCGVV